MNIRHIILRYFLPLIVCFFGLSLISMIPAVQKVYYPAFEKLSLAAVEKSQPGIYFKTKHWTEIEGKDPNKVNVMFNSNDYLRRLIDYYRANGIQGTYDYKAFIVSIDASFTAPLIFFFSLLLVTPSNWKRKLAALVIGSMMILIFAYFTVRFQGYYSVATSGVEGFEFSPGAVKGYKLLHFAFSSVTTITVVLLTWILVAFRKSDFKNIFVNEVVNN